MSIEKGPSLNMPSCSNRSVGNCAVAESKCQFSVSPATPLGTGESRAMLRVVCAK